MVLLVDGLLDQWRREMRKHRKRMHNSLVHCSLVLFVDWMHKCPLTLNGSGTLFDGSRVIKMTPILRKGFNLFINDLIFAAVSRALSRMSLHWCSQMKHNRDSGCVNCICAAMTRGCAGDCG
jgi:hypothetical protein